MVVYREFVFGADIEIPFSAYPSDTDCHEEWELFWRFRASALRRSDRHTRCDASWLDTFEERGYRSMLFVGNGMAQEPQYFAFAGFQATAMDISPSVTSLASTTRWQARALLDAFGVPPGEERAFMREIHRLGGSANYEQGDLFNERDCAGPFDVIVIRRTLHLFDGPRLSEAIRKLKQRLAPRGTLLIEVFQDQVAHRAIERCLQEEGFQMRARSHPTEWNAELLFVPTENR